MKKKVFPIILVFAIFGCIFIALGLFLYQKNYLSSLPSISDETNVSSGSIQDNKTPLTSEEIAKQKIDLIKKRLGLKQYIISGDTYFGNGEIQKALREYIEYYKQNPGDFLVSEKIAESYFRLGKYSAANNYFEKTTRISEKKILSKLYITLDPEKPNIPESKNFISGLDLKGDEKFYYENSLHCLENFHECKVSFQNYFSQIQTQSGKTLEYEPLADIQKAFQNYENFQLDDVSLKNAFIIASYYSHGLYPLSIILSKKELEAKKDYKPLLKIVAQSYFKLGEYESAKAYLGNLSTLEKDDPTISYMLGYIATLQKDYTLANVHLNKAIELNYEKKIDAKRLIIHNQYVSENTLGMLESLRELIEEYEYNENDASIALYENIYAGNEAWAKEKIDGIMLQFPENGNFYAYKAWIERNEGNLSQARKTLLEGNRISENNPFILLNLGYTEKEAGNMTGARIYFDKVISHDTSGEFSQLAKEELQSL